MVTTTTTTTKTSNTAQNASIPFDPQNPPPRPTECEVIASQRDNARGNMGKILGGAFKGRVMYLPDAPRVTELWGGKPAAVLWYPLNLAVSPFVEALNFGFWAYKAGTYAVKCSADGASNATCTTPACTRTAIDGAAASEA